MRVMITGATGFVGGALARALCDAGQDVVVASRDPDRAGALAARGARVHQTSLADPNTLAAAADGCELVFHCAGEERHAIAPAALPWLHIAAIENLLGAASHAGVRRVVLLSCADVTLDNRDRVNCREDQPMIRAPIDRWCQTKLTGEEVALQRGRGAPQGDGKDARSRHPEVTAVRPAWLWGAGDRSHLPALCREGLAGGIRLHGNGENLFSSAHVDNVVQAMRLAASAPDAPGKAFHVSDGEYQTSGEFFAGLADALGVRIRLGFFPLAYALARLRAAVGGGPPWPADVVRRARGSLLDCQQAITHLGYEPIVKVADGMRALGAWVQDEGGAAALAKIPARRADPGLLEEFERAASDGG